jgi:hypothetical protein
MNNLLQTSYENDFGICGFSAEIADSVSQPYQREIAERAGILWREGCKD